MNLSDMKFSRMVAKSKLDRSSLGARDDTAKETLRDLIGQYWDCAYKEGAESRDVDINGDAGAILHAIDLEIAAIRHARDAEVEELKARVAELERVPVEFYYWWHNQPGTNTQDGFREFMRQRAEKVMVE